MKKVLIIAILALNVVSLSYLALSQSNQSFTIKSAIAEQGEDETLYNKVKSDCKVIIEGEAGISGSWMNISYTIPVSGSIALTCENCDIDCPVGETYTREDCTTKDCG